MRLRAAAFLGPVLVAAGVAAGSAAAGSTTSSAGRSITMHLVEKQIGFNFIDNPPRQGFNAPPLMGDQFVFTSELQTRTGAHVGFLDATCMITRGGVHGTGTCYGTFRLKGGQLAGIAGIDFSGNGPDHIAVVGGTGAYDGVKGSITSVSRGENSPFTDDTIKLVYP